LYILPNLPQKGHVRTNTLRAKHIELMRNNVRAMTKQRRINDELVDVPLSVRTANLAVVILKQALDVLVERYHLPRNEADLVKALKRVKSPIKPPSEAQVARLLGAVASHRLRFLYYLALVYGFRIGELLGLQWGDIDFKKGTISISGTLQDVPKIGPQRKPAPKSDAGFRTLPLTAELVTMGKAHLAAMMEEYRE
jgi:integrase